MGNNKRRNKKGQRNDGSMKEDIEGIKGDIAKHQENINQLQQQIQEQQIMLVKKQGIVEYLLKQEEKVKKKEK